MSSPILQSGASAPLRMLLLAGGLVLGPLVVGIAGCGDDGQGAGDDDDDTPPPRRPDRNGAWTTEVALTGGVGRGAQAVWLEDERTVAAAYFRTTALEGGNCFEDVDGADEANEVRWRIEYAVRGFTSWETETITDVLAVTRPDNFDLGLDPMGRPQVATWTGGALIEPPFRFLCNAHDLGLFTRGGGGTWQVETVAENGEQAAVQMDDPRWGGPGEPPTPEASNFGSAVGYWPAFGWGPGDQLVVGWTDRHSGASQQDDFRRSDLEVAYRTGTGGAFAYTPVDWGRGAASFTTIAFDADGNPLVAYENRRNPSAGENDARGVWIARSTDGGTSFDLVRLFANRPSVNGLDLAVSPTDGEIALVHYDPDDQAARLRSLSPDAGFDDAGNWADDVSFIDSRFDEGRDPSVAFDSQGRLALAYYRCRSATASSEVCPPGDDALVFVWRDVDGTWSTPEVVDEGNDLGECGRSPGLVLEEDGGETYAHVVYLCQDTATEGETTLDDQLKIADRDPF